MDQKQSYYSDKFHIYSKYKAIPVDVPDICPDRSCSTDLKAQAVLMQTYQYRIP
jgi:hypothetical protein